MIGPVCQCSVDLKEVMQEVKGTALLYPAAGTDTAPFLLLFYPWIQSFHFNDLGYNSSSDSNFRLPNGFRTLSVKNPDAPIRDHPVETRSDGIRSWRWLPPSSLIQNARGPTGHACQIVRRRGFGQYALSDHAERSIGVFVHRSDSAGESGSNVYFLGNRPRSHEPVSRLWDKLDARLSDRAVVVSDGCLTDFKFMKRAAARSPDAPLIEEPHHQAGREWRAIARMLDRPRTIIWSAVRS